MKPAPFRYEAPDTVEEALELLAANRDAAKVLAGGQSLLPLLNLRLSQPDLLIDVGRIEEGRHLAVSGGTLRIGFGVTQAEALGMAGLKTFNSLFAQALRMVGLPQTRSRGTVVGSLAHADPAAELPAAMVSLDARVELVSVQGSRWVDAGEFFSGPYITALRDDELAVAVELRGLNSSEHAIFWEVARHHGDFASVGLATLVSLAPDGFISRVRFVGFGAFPAPTRLHQAEQTAVDDPAGLREAVLSTPGFTEGGLHTSADLSRHQLAVLAERSLALLSSATLDAREK